MATKKNLELTITNETGYRLKLIEAKLFDGKQDEDHAFGDIEPDGDKKVRVVRLETKVGGQGPKGYADYKAECEKESGELSDKMFRICFELSRKDNNPRYIYILPMGDYVFDGTYKEFGEGIWPTYDDGNTYKADVTIGKPELANVFYHITDTHFNSDAKEMDGTFTRLLYKMEDFTNSHLNQILGIIHTGDICHEDQADEDFTENFERPERKEDYDNRRKAKVQVKVEEEGKDGKYEEKIKEVDRWMNPFHLLEGFGNHDIDVGTSGNADHFFYDKVRHHIISRNECDEFDVNKRMPGVIVDSYDHMHYRWKWHGVNFVQLNLAPFDGKGNNEIDCHHALSFLRETKDDVDQEPLVICFHIFCDRSGDKNGKLHPDRYFSDTDYSNFESILETTNTIAILNGHRHNAMHSVQNYIKHPSDKDIYNCKERPIPVIRAGSFQANKDEEAYHSFIRAEFLPLSEVEKIGKVGHIVFHFYNKKSETSFDYTVEYIM